MAGTYSVEEICSAGLGILGQAAITDIESTTQPHARLCKQVYYITRDALLCAYAWRFATLRVALAVHVDVPAFGYAYKFTLPGDCLRVQAVHDKTIKYTVESGFLLSDSEEISIAYTRAVDESGYFDPAFADALAARIALKLAMPILKKAAYLEVATGFYKDALRTARHNDAMQDNPAEWTDEEKSLWLAAR
jgi:hypothetical protein